LGDRLENLARAIQELTDTKVLRLRRASSIYETEPVGYEAQPLFLNMVIQVTTALKPRRLLQVTQKVENEMGRVRHGRWGPRVIDIDLLFYEDQMVKEPELVIPHPQLALRRFVLVPLAEIAPGFVAPDSGLPVAQLLARCPDPHAVKLFAPPRVVI